MIDFSNVKNIVIPEGEVSFIFRGEEILWKKSRLPIPYQDVEYIEGTGTEYIDTQFIPGSNTRVLMEAYVPKKESGATYVIGTYDWGNGKLYQIRITSASALYMSDYGSSSVSTGLRPADRMIFDKNKNICTINGTVTTHEEKEFTCNTTMLLLAGSTTSDVLVSNPGKIYSCKIWDNDVLVRDFIPALDMNDRPCMYDTVTDEPFYNQGTGEFLYA